MRSIVVEPLTQDRFDGYGQILEEPQYNPSREKKELKVWFNVSHLYGIEGPNARWAYLKIIKHSLPFCRLKRHCVSAEAFIPLTGTSIMPVAPANEKDSKDDNPGKEKIRAFLLDGTKGLIIPAGGWYWQPFPISDEADFLVLLDTKVISETDEREVGPYSFKLY